MGSIINVGFKFQGEIESVNTETIVVAVLSSLLSGLISVLLSFFFYQRLERRKLKMDTARKLFGGKHNMAGREFQDALNEVMVVFSDSKEVIAAMEEFWTILQSPKVTLPTEVANDKLVKLMKAICLSIGIKYKTLPDAYFLRCFSVDVGWMKHQSNHQAK